MLWNVFTYGSAVLALVFVFSVCFSRGWAFRDNGHRKWIWVLVALFALATRTSILFFTWYAIKVRPGVKRSQREARQARREARSDEPMRPISFAPTQLPNQSMFNASDHGPCSACNGTGKQTCGQCRGTGFNYERTQPCTACLGRGEVTCPMCLGSGRHG